MNNTKVLSLANNSIVAQLEQDAEYIISKGKALSPSERAWLKLLDGWLWTATGAALAILYQISFSGGLSNIPVTILHALAGAGSAFALSIWLSIKKYFKAQSDAIVAQGKPAPTPADWLQLLRNQILPALQNDTGIILSDLRTQSAQTVDSLSMQAKHAVATVANASAGKQIQNPPALPVAAPASAVPSPVPAVWNQSTNVLPVASPPATTTIAGQTVPQPQFMGNPTTPASSQAAQTFPFDLNSWNAYQASLAAQQSPVAAAQ